MVSLLVPRNHVGRRLALAWLVAAVGLAVASPGLAGKTNPPPRSTAGATAPAAQNTQQRIPTAPAQRMPAGEGTEMARLLVLVLGLLLLTVLLPVQITKRLVARREARRERAVVALVPRERPSRDT
jgi:hypothetical protein